MLYIIGLGLDNEDDISLKALETAKKCDCFCELYTSKWDGSLENLEKFIRKKITLLSRKDIEEGVEGFVGKAKTKDIALFIVGDPLAATTHSELVIEAKKQKIPVKIIHNSSIYSAIGETGLQLYKFGRSATIAFTGQLEAVKEALETNAKEGLHTLFLLDLDSEKQKYMTAKEAIKMLFDKKIVTCDKEIVVASKLGSDSSKIFCDFPEVFLNHTEVPAVIIVPGKLHFKEKEFLGSIDRYF